MSGSYQQIVEATQKVCDERDLALWFFEYGPTEGLSIERSTENGSWTVKQTVLSFDKRQKPEVTIVAHHYNSPFQALREAKFKVETR